jgi:hypothetical protein
MQEAFLHYLWKLKKFKLTNLKTTLGDTITIKSVGQHNHNSGPDFFNAQLQIGEQLWAGNLEIHIKSSDWFLHKHETDVNYDNVILHVVWEDDAEVFRKNNSRIPTLELKHYVDSALLNNYQKLFSKQQRWINCENDFATVDDFVLTNWLERLYLERLERKAEDIKTLLINSNNDWEAVLFKMLSKNFGLKVNGDAFLSVANSVDFSITRKVMSNQETLEALLFGQAGLLETTIEDPYYITLQKDYLFLKQKFQLDTTGITSIQFFRLRPPNFPTIRLSQLASVYHQNKNLFSKVIETHCKVDFYKLFTVSTSEFWKTRYTFAKISKSSKKQLTKSFIDLLLINTIIPIKFAHAKQIGKDVNEEVLKLIKLLTPENNSIVHKFQTLKPIINSAMDSQSVLQLKNNYCDKNKCLQCAVGNTLMSSSC